LTAPILPSILPEIILVVAATALVAVDLVSRRRANNATLAGIAVIGLLLSALAVYFNLNGQSPRPVLGMLAVDGFASFLMITVLLGMVLVVLYSIEYLKPYAEHRSEFYAFLLAVSLAILIAVSANDLLMVYLGMEFVSITSYILVGFLRKDKRSNEAAIKYFLYGAVASAVMLYGFSMLYGITGSTNLSAIADALTGQTLAGGMRWLSFTSVVLMIVGFGFKTSLVPFHQWAPDTYEGAPSPITGFLSTASKVAGFALMVRVLLVALPRFALDWLTVLAGVSMITMTLGNLVALRQGNIKRLLAYSSIAQAGYILMGLVCIPQEQFHLLALQAFTFNGINGILLYLFGYVFTNLGLFAVVIAIENQTGKTEIKEYAGLVQRSPWLAALLLIFLLSLTGIPPTLGFWGKYFVFGAAVQVRFFVLLIVAVINSAIAAGYYLNIVRYAFFMPAEDESRIHISPSLRVVLAITTVMVLGLGILPGFLIDWASRSAEFLTQF